jgi:Flp pilus assembly secretin CpaC
MKKWVIASAILMILTGALGTAFGQPKVVDPEPRQVQIDILVAQANRDAARRIGLISENLGGVTSKFVNSEQAMWALRVLTDLGLAQIVTKPTLTTLDGHDAVFQIGNQVAVPVVAADGALKVSYQPTGVCMKITPKIHDVGQIALAVDSLISQRSEGSVVLDNGTQAPIFDATQAIVSQELRDGQTWMFAQSYASACEAADEQLPLLAFMPILNRLAGFNQFTAANSVYLVLVTPHAMAPVAVKKQYQVDVRICEGDPDGSREAGTLKILASPRLVTLDGRPGDFNVGGELAALTPEGAVQFVEFGTAVSVLVRGVDDTWVHLDMKMEKTDRTDDPDPSVLRIAGQTARTVGKFKLGEPVRMMLDKGDGKKLWCDVTVTAANP